MEDAETADFAVPFSISASLSPIRLIELPPALLDELKSSPLPVHLKTATGDAGGTALICTSTQTFEIRSMQSSNLIYVAETHRDPEQRSSETGLRAIAQPKGVLELSAKATDALGWVTATLPIFLVEGDADFEGPSDDATRESREAWMDQAPFSAGEFEQGWTAAAAFEHEGVAWRPSATCCVTVWKSMLSAAIIRGVELSQPVSAAQLESAVVEDGLPGSAVDAILQRVSSAGQTKDAAIEEAKLIQWLGEMILRSRGGTKMNKTEFLQQWQGLLPEKWRGAATLEAIKGLFELPDKDSIRLMQNVSGAQASQPAKKPASKWHEKLKASRR